MNVSYRSYINIRSVFTQEMKMNVKYLDPTVSLVHVNTESCSDTYFAKLFQRTN